jgi:3-phosphoshikimate 1-carboxyvinyltransferase
MASAKESTASHSSSPSITKIVRPARGFRGSLMLPGDKSISHRYAMLAGYAEGTTKLENFSSGQDPHSSLGCMKAMGAKVEFDGKDIHVTGVGGKLQQPADDLDCGNSGSTMRMLAGLVAGQKGEFRFIGDESLTVRPMERIRKPLELMGAKIDLTEGHAPMTIHGAQLKAIDFESPIASAQVKTAVLFAGLEADGVTSIAESVRTRDHSEHALRAFGVKLERKDNRLHIRGGQKLKAIDSVTIPGDMSSAAFFLCAALLFEDSNLVLDSLGVNPTRAAMLDVVTAMGGVVKILDVQEQHGEMVGTIQVNRGHEGLKGVDISGELAAQLIDELPVIAAIAPYSKNGVKIRDARELRVKESDRIALVVKNLRAMGAEVTEHEDGMDIPGGQTLRGGVVDSGLDHRITMAFSIAALRAQGETAIEGAEAAAVSFPEFYTWLDELAVR